MCISHLTSCSSDQPTPEACAPHKMTQPCSQQAHTLRPWCILDGGNLLLLTALEASSRPMFPPANLPPDSREIHGGLGCPTPTEKTNCLCRKGTLPDNLLHLP